MVVVLNRLSILLAVVSLFSCSSFGYAQKEPLTSYELSLDAFTNNKVQLEQAIQNCEKNKVPIKYVLLESFDLSLTELKTVLFVLNERAVSRCENGLREKLFYSAAVHRQLSNFYKKDAGDADDYREEIMLVAERRKLDFESRYLAINKETRDALESIEELNKPFLIFETLEQFE